MGRTCHVSQAPATASASQAHTATSALLHSLTASLETRSTLVLDCRSRRSRQGAQAQSTTRPDSCRAAAACV